MGRKAEDVIRLFKYFLDYLPEEVNLIDLSLLTVFRRERLSNKDNEGDTRFTTIPNINEKINMLEETMNDTEYEKSI